MILSKKLKNIFGVFLNSQKIKNSNEIYFAFIINFYDYSKD